MLEELVKKVERVTLIYDSDNNEYLVDVFLKPGTFICSSDPDIHVAIGKMMDKVK